MKGTYEIKSRTTGKVVYTASADDVAADWNYKKKQLIMGFSREKKLIEHKLGFQDLLFTLPEPEVKFKKTTEDFAIAAPEKKKRKKR
jgi:hypothetical protein